MTAEQVRPEPIGSVGDDHHPAGRSGARGDEAARQVGIVGERSVRIAVPHEGLVDDRQQRDVRPGPDPAGIDAGGAIQVAIERYVRRGEGRHHPSPIKGEGVEPLAAHPLATNVDRPVGHRADEVDEVLACREAAERHRSGPFPAMVRVASQPGCFMTNASGAAALVCRTIQPLWRLRRTDLRLRRVHTPDGVVVLSRRP